MSKNFLVSVIGESEVPEASMKLCKENNVFSVRVNGSEMPKGVEHKDHSIQLVVTGGREWI